MRYAALALVATLVSVTRGAAADGAPRTGPSWEPLPPRQPAAELELLAPPLPPHFEVRVDIDGAPRRLGESITVAPGKRKVEYRAYLDGDAESIGSASVDVGEGQRKAFRVPPVERRVSPSEIILGSLMMAAGIGVGAVGVWGVTQEISEDDILYTVNRLMGGVCIVLGVGTFGGGVAITVIGAVPNWEFSPPAPSQPVGSGSEPATPPAGAGLAITF